MITIANQGNTYDLRGLSKDEKPVDKIGNGSTFIEIDTGKLFIFDGETRTWISIDDSWENSNQSK